MEREEVMFLLGVYGVAAVRILPMSGALNAAIASVRQSRNSINILFSDLHGDRSQKLPANIKKSKQRFCSLEIKNLYYQYPGVDNIIFENLSLEVQAGSAVGIVGESGSGKTTLVNLILGLLDSKGSVLINGSHPIEGQNFAGYMSQDSFYIDGSILKNITLASKEDSNEYDDELLAQALHASRLDELVNISGKGIKMQIGERGAKISGGQRQRLSLARLLYFDRELLIMDEPTSAMDLNTETEVLKELRKLKHKKTMILISHNEKILDLCDSVYEIKNKHLIRLD